jgi:hypothetical protein
MWPACQEQYLCMPLDQDAATSVIPHTTLHSLTLSYGTVTGAMTT